MPPRTLALNVPRLRRNLLKWYRLHRRDLPWRRTSDPYRIWISEIMLQQTRVAAVIPYYERFLRLFPHPAALASAPEKELLAAWAGLGYYSRARNLQKAARTIVDLARFPSDYSALLELPGVGAYTAAAVVSIAFGRPHAVLDGNVARVLSRLTAQPGDIRSPNTRIELQKFAGALLHPKRPGEFNQALMELGATICVPKKPLCPHCPLHLDCQARIRGLENQLPVARVRPNAGREEKQILVIEKNRKLLLRKRSSDAERLAGFWELPDRDQVPGATAIRGPLARFRHTIVHTTYLVEVYKADLHRVPNGLQWLAKQDLVEFPLSTITKKALARLKELTEVIA